MLMCVLNISQLIINYVIKDVSKSASLLVSKYVINRVEKKHF